MMSESSAYGAKVLSKFVGRPENMPASILPMPLGMQWVHADYF